MKMSCSGCMKSPDAEDALETLKKLAGEMSCSKSMYGLFVFGFGKTALEQCCQAIVKSIPLAPQATERISDDMFEDPDLDFGPGFGTLIAIGVTVFAVIVITVILCLTCSCCCLYKACRRPRPVVTTATTTVVHSAYPQQPAVPPSYAAAPYQGYQPVAVQPQPGMPVAPYPAQYPPPYPTQPAGPPAYHETVAVGAGAPYPTQPPYNPAYMDPQKPTY